MSRFAPQMFDTNICACKLKSNPHSCSVLVADNNVAASKESSMIGSDRCRLQKKRALNSYSNFPL